MAVSVAEVPAEVKSLKAGGGFAIFDLPGNERKTDSIFVAAELGRVEKIKEFKQTTKHFDINATDSVGRTALMWAADCGQLDALELLLRYGAHVHLAETRTGRTAIHLAARYGSVDVIEALTKVGADVNATDKYGLSPLYFALNAAPKMGHDASKLLMQLGAKHTSEFNVLHTSGLTPEEQAASALDEA